MLHNMIEEDRQVQNLINEYKELVSNGKTQAAQNLYEDAHLFVERNVSLARFYAAADNERLAAELAAANAKVAELKVTIDCLEQQGDNMREILGWLPRKTE